MPPTRALIGVVGGVLGGWLAIMTPSVITIALRMRELGTESGSSFYALVIGAGWLVLIASLIVVGRVSDRLVELTGSRARLARIGVPLLAVFGVLLALAPANSWLAAGWLLAQIPAAVVITTALADSEAALARTGRGLVSGLVGAAPIAALLIGSVIARVLSDQPQVIFAVTGVLSAVIAAPLMWVDGQPSQADIASSPDRGPEPAPLRWWPWVAFLLASFLLSWATSTTNGFVVAFIDHVSGFKTSDVAPIATSAVLLASFIAIISSIGAGAISRGRPRAGVMWTVAAASCSLALILLLTVQGTVGVMSAAALFGASFGIANGVALAIVLMLVEVRRIGAGLGLFTAVTSAPYVLVPAVATLLLAGDSKGGLIALFALAVGTALIATLPAAYATRRLMRA